MDLEPGDVLVVRAQRPTQSWFYAIRFGRYVKVGVTGNLPARLRTLPDGVLKPADLDTSDVEPLCAVPGQAETERLIHALLADRRAVGEWFDCDEALAAVLRGQNSDSTRVRLFDLFSRSLPVFPEFGDLPVPVEF